jgi:hypothetical protein
MSTLQGSGWQQIKRGLTTIDEVIRYSDGMIEDGIDPLNTQGSSI